MFTFLTMNGYTKLFADIVTSTVWQAPNDCRVLWITILALKGKDNICRATVPALAKFCDLTTDKCEEYLAAFQGPDKFSRSKEHEGRRIKPVDGGYLVLNGQKYNDLMRSADRRDYIRGKVADHRAKQKQSPATPVTPRNFKPIGDVNNVNQVNPSDTDRETAEQCVNRAEFDPPAGHSHSGPQPLWDSAGPDEGHRITEAQAAAAMGTAGYQGGRTAAPKTDPVP